MKTPKTVTIIISGGAVREIRNLPDDILIEIRDYDVQEDEGPRIFQDEMGDSYQLSVCSIGGFNFDSSD